jgi:N-6 DNA Methylase/Type I restriction enzyme R protein N terminus (HSDR_N)
MTESISEIKERWNKEAESYKIQEVGSGVQRFVKQVLKSEIFNLSEGELSTNDLIRKNEYLEEKTKKNKRADVIIFINSDIIIPIEIEKFGNIVAGEKQLFEYQHVWDKKYGVLTDGYEWRFYNNKLRIKTFKLHNLLDETESFIEFWKEYIQPENYYLQFFEKAGQLELIADDVSVGNNIQSFFLDITTLIKSFQYKLDIKGYFETADSKAKAEKLSTEITYAYLIQFILYKTLVDNDFSDFSKDFDERLKRVYQGLINENYSDILNAIRVISTRISKNIYRPFIREQEIINQTVENLISKATNQLEDVTPWLDIFIFIKRYSFANVKNDIFGYIYENYLKALYEDDEKKGQYFTDPSVVRFMLEQVGYTAKTIKEKIKAGQLDNISIIDPACGSGTFLYSATDEIMNSFTTIKNETSKQIEDIVTSNIFGLDVEEFPLYLAEMNILMRILPLIMGEKYNNPLEKKIKVFWTKDSIAEFVGSAPITLSEQISFPENIIKPKLDSFIRSEEDLTELKDSMTVVPRRRFDYVIANPPYVSYNECSKQKILIFDLIKNKQAQLSDIFGINLHSIPSNRKKYSPKPNLYIFFIALGLALLKDDGRLCYIIPQTLLVNTDFDVMRYHLAKSSTIEKIIIFNSKIFVGRGLKQDRPIPTSSLIIVVKRQKPIKTHEVEIINYKNADDEIEICLKNIENGNNIIKSVISQSYLLKNVSNWNFLTQNELFTDFYEEFKRKTDDIKIYYDHNLANQKFGDKFYFDGSTNIPKKDVKPISEYANDYYSIPELKSNGYLANLMGQYPKNKEIKIAEGSQGLIIAEPEFKILWKYINFDKFYYLRGKNILPIYQQYCITSDDENEILYLFSILNSGVIHLILNTFCKVQHEDKLSFLLGLTHIKQLVRIPKITENNKLIKDEIVKYTSKMLELEEVRLKDFVNLSSVMVQKFDFIEVLGGDLILHHEDMVIKLQIKQQVELVKMSIQNNGDDITLTDLRNMPILDHAKQAEYKEYIDNLIFALYFNINIKILGLEKSDQIKQACMANKYYGITTA